MFLQPCVPPSIVDGTASTSNHVRIGFSASVENLCTFRLDRPFLEIIGGNYVGKSSKCLFGLYSHSGIVPRQIYEMLRRLDSCKEFFHDNSRLCTEGDVQNDVMTSLNLRIHASNIAYRHLRDGPSGQTEGGP